VLPLQGLEKYLNIGFQDVINELINLFDYHIYKVNEILKKHILHPVPYLHIWFAKQIGVSHSTYA
jgi:hypothetical protein